VDEWTIVSNVHSLSHTPALPAVDTRRQRCLYALLSGEDRRMKEPLFIEKRVGGRRLTGSQQVRRQREKIGRDGVNDEGG
jgi:hypothetical protein